MLGFNSTAVAAFLLNYTSEIGKSLSATQVHKILYCCYGVTLALTGKRLTREHPQAWPFGPVFPQVFKAIRDQKINPKDGEEVRKLLTSPLLYRLEESIRFFSQFPSSKLSAWTHELGSPWDIATDHGKDLPVRLDDLAILNYFRDHVLIEGLTLESSLDLPMFR